MTKKIALVALILLVAITVFAYAACGRARGDSSKTDTKSTPVAKPAVAAPPVATATDAKVPPVALPGTTIHEIAKGDTLPKVVSHYLNQSSYMTKAELADAIRKQNPNLDALSLKGGALKAGDYLIIPGYDPNPTARAIPVSKDFEVRAIYLTGAMAGGEHGLSIVERWRAAGGNAVVFDIKDSDGSVSIHFDHPLAPQQKYTPIHNLPKYIRWLHEHNLHVICRIAIFRDENIANNHTDLTIHSAKTGQAGWRENGKLVWTDPSNPEVQDYNIALAKYVATAGADEVQFDYVRFPAEGDQKDARFYYMKEHPDWQRADVIAHFLEKAYAQIHPTGALFSLDVFGVMAWQRSVDLSHTGQDIVRMAKFCDVLSPMIYPSHFFGMDGYTLPGDAPEHFIGESMERFGKITAGSGVVLRPWLQAFGWKTKTYSPEYIEVQVKTAKSRGGDGFLFWNARNDYTKPFAAMPEMRASKELYFRGDELGETKKPLPAPTQVAQ
ncbi:MAG TPA: putative glycoside hydrolase [Candidatus Koribacter sp.]|jgi:hypothetical protein